MIMLGLRRRTAVQQETLSSPLAKVASLLPPRLALLAVGTLLLVGSLTAWMVTGGPASPATALATTGSGALGIASLVAAAALPAPLTAPAAGSRALAYRLGTWLALIALALAVLATCWLAGDLVLHAPLDPTVYVSDASAFNHYDAELVLHGVNPYTADARFWDALRRFPSSGATPLQRGRYAHLVWGPSLETVRSDVRQEIADPASRGPEFAPASLHSYPALAFLVYLPVVWAGLGSTLPLSLAALVAFLVIIGHALPARQRLIGWAVLLANSIGVTLALRGAFEVIALSLALLAWQTLPRRVVSPVLLGLACAVKQVVWPLVPLYLVLSVRRDGWRTATVRASVLLAAFLAPNLPFLLAAPAAWARSLLLPVSLPLFPTGVGLIELARGGALPLWPQPVYTLLEVGALAGLVVWVALRRPLPRPELLLLLGLLPFALAWRSLVSYFALLPALGLYAALPLLRRAAAPAELTATASPSPPRAEQHSTGVRAAIPPRLAAVFSARRWTTRAIASTQRALPVPDAVDLRPARVLQTVPSLRAAVTRWLARADVRAALAVTVALRICLSLAALAVPLALPEIYPWHDLLGPNHFTVADVPHGGPHTAYSPLDYLLLPWNRWDSVWYTDIAQHGYGGYGSTAFMPLYPLLIRLFAPLLGGNPLAAALLLATGATFFALLALYQLAERLMPGRGLGPLALLVAALLPLAFFLMAGYTESLFLALSLWAILAALEGRWGRVALLAALAALTRQQGVLLAILAIPAAWRAAQTLWRRLAAPRSVPAFAATDLLPLAAIIVPGLAYVGWLGALRLVFHAPAPWEVLTHAPGWDQRFSWPGASLLADALWLRHPPNAIVNGTELDLFMAVGAAVLLVVGRRRLPSTLWLYLAAMWCAALIKVLPDGRTVSAGRYMLALLPLCVFPAAWLARGGPPLRIAWVVVWMLVALVCVWAFVLWGWVG